MRNIVFLLTVFLAWGGWGWAGDFRAADWGMSEAEVKASEKKAVPVPGSPPGLLLYDGLLLGKLKVRITYRFADGKLVKGEYNLSAPLKTTDYGLLRSILVKKYGNPRSDTAAGGLTETVWAAGGTEIDLLGRGLEPPGQEAEPSAAGRDLALNGIVINYYDRKWYRRSIETTKTEEAEDKETEGIREKTVGGWVEVPFGYRWDNAYWSDF